EQIIGVNEPYGLLTFETSKESIIDVLRFLKDHETFKFNFLTDITAVHYPEKTHAIAVVYHLHSMVNKIRVRIKVFLNADNPSIPTASEIWNGANWMERETYDFFGVD